MHFSKGYPSYVNTDIYKNVEPKEEMSEKIFLDSMSSSIQKKISDISKKNIGLFEDLELSFSKNQTLSGQS